MSNYKIYFKKAIFIIFKIKIWFFFIFSIVESINYLYFFMNEAKKLFLNLIIITFFAIWLFLVYKISSILIILCFALFLNILFAPFLNRMNKWKIRDWIWIILIYIFIILFVLITIFSIVPIFINQISILIDLSYKFINDIILLYNSKWIDWFGLPEFIKWFLNTIDISEILTSIQKNIWQISSFVSDNLKSFLTSWAWIIFSITNIVMNFVLLFIFTFFIALERKEIRNFFYKVIPENTSKYILSKENTIVKTLYNWLKSQLILWISIFIITLIWLLIIRLFWVKIDEIFTLALIAWMMEFVPYIGPFIALLPALAIALWLWWKATVIILILYIAIQQLENNVLVPYVMWKTLSLSPFAVLIAMVIGWSLMWIIWIIIAVPVVAIIQIFLIDYLKNKKIK